MGCEPRTFLNHCDEVPAVCSACCTTQPAFSRSICIYVLESIMGNSTTFPLLACSKLLGWIVQRKKIISHFLQIQLSTTSSPGWDSSALVNLLLSQPFIVYFMVWVHMKCISNMWWGAELLYLHWPSVQPDSSWSKAPSSPDPFLHGIWKKQMFITLYCRSLTCNENNTGGKGKLLTVSGEIFPPV